MKSRYGMIFLVLILGIAGAALLATLIVHHGAMDVVAAVETAGWGIIAVIAFQLVPMFFDVLTWRVLFPRPVRPRVGRLFLIHWIGDAVSTMLPVAQVGGELVRIRLISAERPIRPGEEVADKYHRTEKPTEKVSVPIAASTVLVGLTIGVGTQIIFTLSGLAVLLAVVRHNEAAGASMLGPVLIGAAIALAAVAGFYAVQRLGIFRIAGVIVRHVTKGKQWSDLIDRGAVLDIEVRTMYGRRKAIAASALWNMGTWISGVFEVWLGLWALGWGYGGGPAAVHGGLLNGLAQAYVLESMTQAIRSAAFLVPGALGVQEGGYVLMGAMLGIPGDIALALALIRRARELAFGVPGIFMWQWLEGRRLLGQWKRPGDAARSDIPAPREALRAGG